MNSSQRNESEGCDPVDSSQTNHDVMASLAIANGFSSALDTSFADLLVVYNNIVSSMSGDISESQLEQLKQTEQDCKFCISRLARSIEQLKSNLDNAQKHSFVGDITSVKKHCE